MVLAREINGQEHTFGVSGKLIMNALVMYDHQTDSLWSQFLSEAVDGPLAGSRLQLLPAQLLTWQGWVEGYPDTLVLDKTGGAGGGQTYGDLGASSYDPYGGYYQSGSAGVLGEANADPRLASKSLVLGLNNDKVRRAYPGYALAMTPVLNDEYDGRPIVLAFDQDSGVTAVFVRVADGTTLTFEAIIEEDGSSALMRDTETGSVWSRMTGLAVSGPLEGQKLEQLPSFLAFWFTWSDFHPDTELCTCLRKSRTREERISKARS